MPRCCAFREDVIMHRATRMARRNARHNKLIGVRVRYTAYGFLTSNVKAIIFGFNSYLNQLYRELPDNIIWCTEDEYNHNWPFFASEMIRQRYFRYNNFPDTTPTPASQMPANSIGFDKWLNTVARDTNGRWIYLKNDGNSVEVVISDEAPSCEVVCRECDTNDLRDLSPRSYWTTVLKGQNVLVRPPLGCPENVTVPVGTFYNSRFPFREDDSYINMTPFCMQEIDRHGSKERLQHFPNAALYGQLVLHHDSDNDEPYYTLTPVYPDVFGNTWTRYFKSPTSPAFSDTASSYCSDVQNSINPNTNATVYRDCYSSASIPTDTSTGRPVTFRGIPTTQDRLMTCFTDVNGELKPNLLRIMEVDDDGNKTYTYIDDSDVAFYMLNHFPFDMYDSAPLVYSGRKLLWDYRNKAWINESQSVYIPSSYARVTADRYTHISTVEYQECPICHGKSVWTSKYYLIYFADGERLKLQLCDRCINHADEPEGLNIVLNNGEILTIKSEELRRVGPQTYTLNRWWVRADLDGDEGFIDDYAHWNSDTKEWELNGNNDGNLILRLTEEGYSIESKYCRSIHSYFYKPSPSFFKNETEDTNKFFGIELEVMDGGESDSNARTVCDGQEELYAKHDGSLRSGMELVSHPCSVSWHLNNLWGTVLSRLSSLGYRARSGSGIHVHVSKKYWEDNGGIEKIANLIAFCDINREALRIYANRTSDMFDRWTHRYLTPLQTQRAMQHKLQDYNDPNEAMQSLYRDYYDSSEHYCVVNLCNSATVEIRAFASTLRIDRMHSIIQFVDVLTELSTEATLDNPITFDMIKDRAATKGYADLLNDRSFIGALAESHPIEDEVDVSNVDTSCTTDEDDDTDTSDSYVCYAC